MQSVVITDQYHGRNGNEGQRTVTCES